MASDGTAAGTGWSRTSIPGAAASGPGELWTTDGTIAGTILVRDIKPGGLNPKSLTKLGRTVLFAGRDRAHGVELSRTAI